MIREIKFHIDKLNFMKKYPKNIYYIGNLELLKKRTISIVGTRKPNSYTKQYTHDLSKELVKHNTCIVSGAAMGVDAIAHNAAGAENTIAIAGTGLDMRYPAVNKRLIEDIETKGLMLSQFAINTPSQKYNFPMRNELIVSLGEVLIVTQADLNSGTMRSIEFALKMNKPIFVLAHRIGESLGTNKLLAQGLAKAIYDIDKFIEAFVGFKNEIKHSDDFLEYCKLTPVYDEVIKKFPVKLFEYELSGKIKVENGLVFVI
jgi:DNA processing protein